MALRLGATLRGSKYSFRLVEKLGDKIVLSPVFKAEVLPGVQSLLPKSRWAVVKSANLENETQVDSLVREYRYYKKPFIESSRNFRKLCDIINDPKDWTDQKPFCLAFEWMDATLTEVSFEEHMKDPVLVANIIKVCLEAFAELEKEHLVYTDLKPANVLISTIDGQSEAKIGDLGLVGPEGRNPHWVQPEAFRAPEILQRIDPSILGNSDNINKTLIHPMAWCLAKIILLFDPSCSSIPPPCDANENLQTYFKLAQNLTTTRAQEDSNELLLQIPSFEVWADLALDAGVPNVVLDVLRILAIPSPIKRPWALQALQSPEYKALQKVAAAYRN